MTAISTLASLSAAQIRALAPSAVRSWGQAEFALLTN